MLSQRAKVSLGSVGLLLGCFGLVIYFSGPSARMGSTLESFQERNRLGDVGRVTASTNEQERRQS